MKAAIINAQRSENINAGMSWRQPGGEMMWRNGENGCLENAAAKPISKMALAGGEMKRKPAAYP
jgi:hypothetical protein